MAATGLLNINPYRKGVAVDISTKPTSLYIDIQNKERARTEALDRYFMDYDKNINPAGMKANDIDDLTKLQQSSKAFYFQNRKAIQNPMLDGGKAYNQFVNFNKQQLALVSQSKDAAARGKVGGQAVASTRAKGWVIAPQTFDDLKANEQPVMSPNFRPFDAAKFDAYEPFDAAKYTKDVYAGDRYLSKKDVNIRQLGGKDILKEEISFDPKNLQAIQTIATTNYQNNKGFKTHVDEIAKDTNELKELNSLFSKYTQRNIQNLDDVATALTISLSPYKLQDKATGTNVYYAAGARDSGDNTQLSNQIDSFIKDLRSGESFGGAEGANFEKLNVSPRIAEEYKIDDETPAIARGVTSGKFFAIYGFLKDKNGKPTNIPDMTKVTEIPEMTFKSTIANKSLPSNFKAKGIVANAQKEQPTKTQASVNKKKVWNPKTNKYE